MQAAAYFELVTGHRALEAAAHPRLQGRTVDAVDAGFGFGSVGVGTGNGEPEGEQLVTARQGTHRRFGR
jgi:hypothetical protein